MSELTVFDCEQGSEAWFACRAGIPTASEFSTVLAKGRSGGESVTRRKYLLTLIGELMTGTVQESYQNAHMERGKEMENEARELYAMVKGVQPERVGFMRRGFAGCSPDSLIGDDGLLEIKTALPHIQLARILENRLPPEHVAQVQGQLLISGRSYCDFVSYWPALPILIVRVNRDEEYITKLSAAIDEFNAEMVALTMQINGKAA
jgi:hypothetical protein